MSTAPTDFREARGPGVVPLHPNDPTPVRGGENTSTHVDQTRRQHQWQATRAMVLVAAIALIDVIIIKTTWNQVLLEAEIVSWLLAIFTALGGAAAMWTSGKLTAITQVFPSPLKTTAAVAAALTWAALGAGLFWLRWNAAEFAVTSTAIEGQTSDDTGAHMHRLMAIIMISLYLVPGVLAWIDGYLLNNPIAAHQRRTAAKLADLDQTLHTTEAEATMVDRLVAMHTDEISLIDTRAAEATRANAALADELLAHARAEILRHLATPNAGGITHPSDHPHPTTS